MIMFKMIVTIFAVASIVLGDSIGMNRLGNRDGTAAFSPYFSILICSQSCHDYAPKGGWNTMLKYYSYFYRYY